MQAMRKDYKKPRPGKSPKGYKKGWRWIDRDGEVLNGKYTPISWDNIINEEETKNG